MSRSGSSQPIGIFVCLTSAKHLRSSDLLDCPTGLDGRDILQLTVARHPGVQLTTPRFMTSSLPTSWLEPRTFGFCVVGRPLRCLGQVNCGTRVH